MQRCTSEPRVAWREAVERHGLSYHTHEASPYWDESVCYTLTPQDVARLETAAQTLHQLCLVAAEVVLQRGWLQRLGIPPRAWPVIERSWERDDFSLYGRFDLAYDGVGEPKLLEYNADTPTALVEAAVTQWFWLQDTRPHVGVMLVMMLVSFWSEETEHTRPEPPARQSAAVVKLPLQAGGQLEGQEYATISAHAVVEVGQQGLHYDRHEYSLRPSRGEGVLLVQAPEGFAGEWLWLEPVPVPDGLTPQVLGALRVGQAREWGDLKLPITRLQVGKVVSAEPGRAREFWPASMHYALLARRDGEWQVARWTEESVRCYIGRTLSDREVLAAFAAH